MRISIHSCTLSLVIGDISSQQTDAIVNAANCDLAGGGGVDGAIHAAAGPELIQETSRKYPNGCPTGSAVLTGAGKLSVQYIIHAVGPIWEGGIVGEPKQLRSAYRRSLELAVENGCRTIAFPLLSAGAYGYPLDLATETAFDEVIRFLYELEGAIFVRFVLFDAATFGAALRSLEAVIGKWKPKVGPEVNWYENRNIEDENQD